MTITEKKKLVKDFRLLLKQLLFEEVTTLRELWDIIHKDAGNILKEKRSCMGK